MSPDQTFLSCDWGTTSLRLRLVERPTAKVLAEAPRNHPGIRTVAAAIPATTTPAARTSHFAKILADLIGNWPDAAGAVSANSPVVLSGMASSSIGWKELPYAITPFPLNGSATRSEWLTLESPTLSLPLLLVSGLASEHDMMRGEETQIMGLLSMPDYTALAAGCLIIIPGTHSKHVRIQDNEIRALTTYMTGELFDVLHTNSILRFTTSDRQGTLLESPFLEGVASANQHGLMPSLFQTRTRGVLHNISNASNLSFLSGLLIGAELTDASRDTGNLPLLLAATDPLAHLYTLALHEINPAASLKATSPSDLAHAVTAGQALILNHFPAPTARRTS